MIDKIKNVLNQRYFHIIVIVVIVIILLFILLMTMLDYNENGEKNMPFNLTKITVISTSEGMDKQVEGKKWAFDIDQNNDIFLYIDKNDQNKIEAIKSITLENFNVKRENQNGEVKIYKPDALSENKIFTNKEEYVENVITFNGDIESDFKNLKISNQGDVLAFRCSTKNIASYESDAEEEINHGELLKKAGVTLENLKETLTFDITINLYSGKSYKAQIKLDLPTGNILEEATCNTEITDLSDVIFKRINN